MKDRDSSERMGGAVSGEGSGVDAEVTLAAAVTVFHALLVVSLPL
jgi:hypothetical protein